MLKCLSDGAYENTLLHLACKHEGNAGAVGRLIEAGAWPNELDDKGHTPLYNAVCAGHAQVVRVLLGAPGIFPLDRQYEHGNTLLHLAAQGNRRGVIQALLEAGADGAIKNEEGKTYQSVV